ncbi:hypothetical protein NE237_005545 [Protea cynaroides]|uniref:Uncharacterized protein n=1 Tax=Protea cynaroides TaxID=273540 RepID=A0A9Q0GNC9_9MAGN|nr:hypothetical protein NE237_005545 [Protea cynaroides]
MLGDAEMVEQWEELEIRDAILGTLEEVSSDQHTNKAMSSLAYGAQKARQRV